MQRKKNFKQNPEKKGYNCSNWIAKIFKKLFFGTFSQSNWGRGRKGWNKFSHEKEERIALWNYWIHYPWAFNLGGIGCYTWDLRFYEGAFDCGDDSTDKDICYVDNSQETSKNYYCIYNDGEKQCARCVQYSKSFFFINILNLYEKLDEKCKKMDFK